MSPTQRYFLAKERPPTAQIAVLRLLVTGLQVFGIFPYVWPRSSPPRRPKLSLPLFLWALAIKILLVSLSALSLKTELREYPATTVGSVALLLSSVCFVAGLHIGFLFLTAMSPSLARLLFEFEVLSLTMIKKIRLSAYFKAHKASVAYFTLGLLSTGTYLYDGSFDIDTVPSIFYQIYIELTMMLILFVFTASLMILMDFMDQSLEEATSESRKDVKYLTCISVRAKSLSHDEGHCHVNESSGLIPRLEKLATVIEKVSRLRDELAAYVCACVLWVFLLSLILLIASIYNCLSAAISFNTLLRVSLTPFFFLISTCQAAQIFSNKVESTAKAVHQLGNRFINTGLHVQVQPLVQALKHLQPFDLCGWVTLSNNTIVSMGSFIATYVVVLMQVGLTPVQRPNDAMSSANYTN